MRVHNMAADLVIVWNLIREYILLFIISLLELIDLSVYLFSSDLNLNPPPPI